MAQSSAHLPYSYARHLPLKPLSTEQSPYSWFRLPLPADGETPPGAICWGTVGDMPSPERLPGVDFNTVERKHTEKKRKERDVRIENPDDPEQYIQVKRADQIVFFVSELETKAGANTSAKPAEGIAAYDPARIKSFQPTGGTTEKKGELEMNLKNGPNSL